MARTVRYLTHPQVVVDPAVPVPEWKLSAAGLARVAALAARPGVLAGTTRVVTSTETKALETARPLAAALGAKVEARPLMHENDRSATGFLPPEEFERVADRFFARPGESVRGWETATDAQARIAAEVAACLAEQGEGDLLLVGHGAVGTLLYCLLSGLPADRRFDQLPGGGCWFAFDIEQRRPGRGWQPMETLLAPGP